MSSLKEFPAVVFDTGSAFCKVGFVGESFPRCVFPSVVGRFRNGNLLDGFPDVYCGKEAISKRGVSDLRWPVRNGLVTDWDELEKLWHHTFYKELFAAPEDCKVLHATHPLGSPKDKERLAEIMFESFNVRAIYMANSPSLVLHSTGRTSGVVWESGANSALAAPVFEGFLLQHATISSPLTGETLSKTMQTMLAALGYSFTTPAEIDIINNIKAKMCFVSKNYAEDIAAYNNEGYNIQYQLPDGQQILIGKERFQCPEVLFQPSLQGLNCPSITDVICSSIDKCDIDFRSLFYENVVLAGGSTLIKGFTQRLVPELENRNKLIKVNVDTASDKHYAAWIGGSIIASLPALKNSWMTTEEYDDSGVNLVHHYFF